MWQCGFIFGDSVVNLAEQAKELRAFVRGQVCCKAVLGAPVMRKHPGQPFFLKADLPLDRAAGKRRGGEEKTREQEPAEQEFAGNVHCRKSLCPISFLERSGRTGNISE